MICITHCVSLQKQKQLKYDRWSCISVWFKTFLNGLYTAPALLISWLLAGNYSIRVVSDLLSRWSLNKISCTNLRLKHWIRYINALCDLVHYASKIVDSLFDWMLCRRPLKIKCFLITLILLDSRTADSTLVNELDGLSLSFRPILKNEYVITEYYPLSNAALCIQI